MPDILSHFYQLADWRFGIGLLVGVVLTLRYVVIGIYHPIIREMETMIDRRHDDPL